MHYHVAVVEWMPGNEMTRMICAGLQDLGHRTALIELDEPIPDSVNVIFSFGPYGKFLKIPLRLAEIPEKERPIFVHWNTEGIPDLRFPWPCVRAIGAFRSLLGRLEDSTTPWHNRLMNTFPLSIINRRLTRYRYIGDYYYAHHHQLIDIFGDTSQIYGAIHTQHGLKTLYIPWGVTPLFYEDLNLERDIDVLWMGNRAGRRRGPLLDRIQRGLEKHGLKTHFADGEQNPFIFSKVRTRYLNRAKITLNIARTWYDDNYSRFSFAAPNRSLIVSEPLLDHCPIYEAGVHYIEAHPRKIVDTIRYYLDHEKERQEIVENAYQLVMRQLTLEQSLEAMMNAVDEIAEINPVRVQFLMSKPVEPLLHSVTLPTKTELPSAPTVVTPPLNGKRVLMIAPQPFFEPRGTPISVFQRLKGLSDLGYEVDLLTYHVGQNVDLPGLNILRGPHVSFIKQVKIGPSLPKLFLDVLLIWKAYQMLQSIKYDLIHTHEEAAFMGVLFSKLYNIPHLYDMHSSLPSQLKNFRFGNFWPILPLFRWLERLVLNTCDGLITIGADLEAYASTLNPSIKQVHIENLAIYEDGTSPKPFTVDEIKFSLGLNDKRLIVYTGTFERYQGLDLFLDSVNPILDRNPGLAVVMVGGKPDQVEVYRQQAAQLGISRQMIFTGIIPPAEAMVYLEMADYLVSPRTEGLSVPLKIYSYLYAGKPILATDIYAHTQVLDETVALIVPPHRQGLMDGLQRLIDDEALCKRIGYQAKRFAEKRFNPEQYTAKIDIIYRKILPFKDATETVLPSKTAVSEKIGQSYRSEIVR